jgi:hypothetical protein
MKYFYLIALRQRRHENILSYYPALKREAMKYFYLIALRQRRHENILSYYPALKREAMKYFYLIAPLLRAGAYESSPKGL